MTGCSQRNTPPTTSDQIPLQCEQTTVHLASPLEPTEQHQHQRPLSLSCERRQPHRASTPVRPPSLASKASSGLLSFRPITVHTCYRGHIRIRYLSRHQSHPQDVEKQSRAAASASKQDLSPAPKLSFPRTKCGYAGTTWNEGGLTPNPRRFDGLISSSAMSHTMVRGILGLHPYTPGVRINNT